MNGNLDTEFGYWAVLLFIAGMVYYMHGFRKEVVTARASQILHAVSLYLAGAAIPAVWWLSAHHGLMVDPGSDSFWRVYKGYMQLVAAGFWGLGAVSFVDAFLQWSWGKKVINFIGAFILAYVASNIVI